MAGRRKYISFKTKLASALIEIGAIPHEHAKLMTEDQVLSLFQFDHGILHAIDPIDEFWNLTPRFIAPHRIKSHRDTAIVAKVKRIEKRPEKWRNLSGPRAGAENRYIERNFKVKKISDLSFQQQRCRRGARCSCDLRSRKLCSDYRR
jgi:hypothetical protein